MPDALNIVQKFFPQVTAVEDGTKTLEIEVTNADSKSAAVRNHKSCALAVACKKKFHADGVIISVSTAYVIDGKKATRYKLPESASREIVSFDRAGGFASGEYYLKPPSKDQKLGQIRGGGRPKTGKSGKIKRQHFTSGIRTALGSKQAA